MIRTILVEDDNGFRQCVKKILSSRYPSIQLMEAGDGMEAMSKIDLAPPDLIFIDIQLPGINGLLGFSFNFELNPLGYIPRGLPRIRHTGESRYPGKGDWMPDQLRHDDIQPIPRCLRRGCSF